MSIARSTDAKRPISAEVVALAAVFVCVAAGVLPPPMATPLDRRPPNVLLVVTDDQPWDTLPMTIGRPAMPWLESQLEDPTDHWVRFTNAFVNVPLCCPSRATMLTGRFAHHSGVEDNGDGAAFDEASSLAPWLEAAGYRTAFIGKYLNGYPWGRGPYVPVGWDRFLAKQNIGVSTTYERYPFVDQGVPLIAGHTPGGYATTALADEAFAFLRGAAHEQPWFLMFAPTAPHDPSIPSLEDVGSFADEPIATPSERLLNDVQGKPAWVRSLPPIDPAMAASLDTRRRRMLETLTGVDRALGHLWQKCRRAASSIARSSWSSPTMGTRSVSIVGSGSGVPTTHACGCRSWSAHLGEGLVRSPFPYRTSIWLRRSGTWSERTWKCRPCRRMA